MSEKLNPVEATGKKTIEVGDENTVRDVLAKLTSQVKETEDLRAKFQAYLETFKGKANLGMFAEIINRDLRKAQEWQADELARKLGLTTIKKAQEAQDGLNQEARLRAQAAAQERVSKANEAPLPQTAQAEQAGKPKAISDYVGNSALGERMKKAGL